MNPIKETLRRIIRSTGYDIKKFKASGLGVDPFQDMQTFLEHESSPLIFDVGANVGQTIKKIAQYFPDATTHSFEPSPTTFAELQTNHSKMGWSDASIYNLGVGSERGTLPLLENDQSYMTSFLEPGALCTGEIARTTEVDVVTLDDFTSENDIPFIHVLKSDTQGFDFEVLKGSKRLMQENRIALIYFEFIFSKQYENVPVFDEVFRFLTNNNFRLVTFYRPHFQRSLISWTDVLFVSDAFYAKWYEGR